MNALILTPVALIAGFNLGLVLKLPDDHRLAAPTKTLTRPSSKTGRAWSANSLAPATRMLGLAAKAATLASEDWPIFFRSQLHSSETARLAARLWAQSDPSGFWAWLRKERDPLLLDRFANDFLKTWAATNPEAAMDAVIQITDKRTGDLLRRSVVDITIEKDLQKGLELAARAGDFNRFSWGPRDWMKVDPAAAVQGLAKLPAISDYREFLRYALPIWVETDPLAALAWMTNEPSLEDGRSIRPGFTAAAKVAPQAALDAALEITDPSKRNEAVAGVVASGTIELDQLTEVLVTLPLSIRARVGQDLISARPATTSAELRQSSEILSLLPANKNTRGAVDHLARNWGSIDRDASWEWALSLTDPAMRRRAIAAIVPIGASGEPELLDVIATLPLLDLSNDLFQNALHQMPVDEQDAWIGQLPPDRRAWAESQHRN